MIAGFILTSAFIGYVAKTVQEYTINATILAALANDLLILISLRWRYLEIFKLSEKLENIFEERK